MPWYNLPVWLIRPLIRRNAAGIPYYFRGRPWPAWFLLGLPLLLVCILLVRKVYRQINWRAAVATVIASELIFMVWVSWAVKHGHWVYNENRILGPRVWGIPIEEPLLYYWMPQIFAIALLYYVKDVLRKRAAGEQV